MLAFLISISVLNAGLTDLKRHRADAKMNATPVTVVSRDHATKLRHIRPGDVVVVHRGETAPVDFVVLAGCGRSRYLLHRYGGHRWRNIIKTKKSRAAHAALAGP